MTPKKQNDSNLLKGQVIQLQGVFVLEEDESMTRYIMMKDMQGLLKEFGATVGSIVTRPEKVTTLIFGGEEERSMGSNAWEGKKQTAYEKEVKRRIAAGEKEMEVYETLDDLLSEYKDSGLLDALVKNSYLADFRQKRDKEGNLKNMVEAGIDRTMSKLTSHKIDSVGLAKLPKI